MPEIPELFKGLRITNYYRYLLYLCGTIFILSLFLDIKIVDANHVRHILLWVIIAALGIWFFEDRLEKVNRYAYEYFLKQYTMDKYYNFAFILVSISSIVQIIVWVIVLYFLVLK